MSAQVNADRGRASRERSGDDRAPWSARPGHDPELVAAVLRGDRDALEALTAFLEEPLYRYVYYRLGGEVAEVEEVVQETFLVALRGLGRYRGEAGLSSWVRGIARNLISARRRRRARERIASALEAADPHIEAALARLDTAALPDEVLEREETQEMVGAALASLPPEYEEVLRAKYVDGRPVNEIARGRGTSAKAVESMLTRARVAFRKTFELIARPLTGGGFLVD